MAKPSRPRRTPMAVGGNGHGNGTHAASHNVLRDEANQITDAVARIVAMTDAVSAGADEQVQSLDTALSGLNQMTVSLRETATQAGAVTASTDNLASSINEVAASIEQVTSSSERLAGLVRQTASSIQQSST